MPSKNKNAKTFKKRLQKTIAYHMEKYEQLNLVRLGGQNNPFATKYRNVENVDM